jgi:hypothetical protein
MSSHPSGDAGLSAVAAVPVSCNDSTSAPDGARQVNDAARA